MVFVLLEHVDVLVYGPEENFIITSKSGMALSFPCLFLFARGGIVIYHVLLAIGFIALFEGIIEFAYWKLTTF